MQIGRWGEMQIQGFLRVEGRCSCSPSQNPSNLLKWLQTHHTNVALAWCEKTLKIWGENKDIAVAVLLVQQGHYWSYLRAEPFCAGFGGFSVWGKLLGYPISCHVIFPLQRYVISGRLYLEGNFVRGSNISHWATLYTEEKELAWCLGGSTNWLGWWGKYYWGWWGD